MLWKLRICPHLFNLLVAADRIFVCAQFWHVIVYKGKCLGSIWIYLVKLCVRARSLRCRLLLIWEIYRINSNHLHFVSASLANPLNRLSWRSMEHLGHIKRIVSLNPSTLISDKTPCCLWIGLRQIKLVLVLNSHCTNVVIRVSFSCSILILAITPNASASLTTRITHKGSLQKGVILEHPVVKAVSGAITHSRTVLPLLRAGPPRHNWSLLLLFRAIFSVLGGHSQILGLFKASLLSNHLLIGNSVFLTKWITINWHLVDSLDIYGSCPHPIVIVSFCSTFGPQLRPYIQRSSLVWVEII